MWQLVANGLLTALTLLVALVALKQSGRALERVEEYKLTPKEVRELVAEIENVLEKWKVAAARSAMRSLRESRTEEKPGVPAAEEKPPADVKAELWALVRQRNGGGR